MTPTQFHPAKGQPLIDDLRLLGRLLGDVIREHAGLETFGLIGRYRAERQSEKIKRGIHICINGIAADLRNTD